MPELEKQRQEQDRAVQPPAEGEGSWSSDTVLALQSLAHVRESYSFYRMSVVDFLAFDADDKLIAPDINKFIESLQSYDAFLVLLLLWKESRFSTPEDLKRAGLPPKKCHSGLTRRALGEILAEGNELRRAMANRRILPTATEMFLRRAERLTEDLFYFGLVEEYVEPPAVARPNWKPLRATARLDQLMRRAGIVCAHFRRAADNPSIRTAESPQT